MAINTINPATGKVIQSYEEMDAHLAESIIEKTQLAFLQWCEINFSERTKCMNQAADILLKNKNEYATLIANEMGKPIKAGIAEIEKCAWVCQYFAANAPNFLQDRFIKTEMTKSFVTFEPLGIIFAIMPWNFPFWQVFRFAAPTIMAGNAVLLKHAPISTGAALAIENIFKTAGFPENLFRALLINNDIAKKVIQHKNIKAATLTGSDKTGKTVGAEAAQSLKKIVLELGGNDPYIILADADLELAAEAAVASRMLNSGQVCIAAKRLITVPNVKKEFQQLVLKKLQNYKMGDPLDETVNFGPLARADLREHLQQQVEDSVRLGATLIQGGTIPDGPGFYYPPTVLDHVKKGMPAYDEELFGPVISFIDATDEEDAMVIANDTQYGLSAAIFTRDIKKGEYLAVKKIQAGTVCVNDFVRSDPRLPFGGIKGSGHGRELSMEGIHEFVNIKTISVK